MTRTVSADRRSGAGSAGVGRARSNESVWADRIATHVSLVENRLSSELDELREAWDHDDVEADQPFALDLPHQLRQLLERGGKRTRPVMTLLGWVAGDVRDDQHGYEDMILASAAIEMLHCFALVHDDVMDESATRRGEPTVHARSARLHARHDGRGDSDRFGDSIAVLVGDLAHSEADRLAAGMPAPMRRVWQQMVLELIAGQLRDVVGSAVADRRIGYARLVARQKTGSYTVTRPLQLGAVAAGADGAALAALTEYGHHAGEAFALRDDILGVYGDPGSTGKPAGDDIRSGKPTVLLALAAETLRGPAATALAVAGSPRMSDDQVRSVQDAMVDHGVVDAVETMIDDRVGSALAALESPSLSADGVAGLTRVLADLARRGR